MTRLFEIFVCVIISPSILWASCDCGSTDPAAPCTGNSITVTVAAGTPNGGTAEDAVFSWAFNSGGSDAICGQFANGDWWVAPASGESSVTITGITTTSAGAITADADPIPEAYGLLDNTNTYGGYSAAQEVIANLPTSYSSVTSIVAAIQRDEATEGDCGTAAIVGECVDAYNVLTVLTSVPDDCGANSIRPNITGDTKSLLDWDDFDLTKIPSESFLTGTDSAGLEAIRLRWSHSTEIFALIPSSGQGYSEGGRAFRSHILIDDYGGGTAATWYNDLMRLFSDDNTIEEKKPAIAAMLSYGMDLYNAIHNDSTYVRYWGTGATQHPGKFLPAVLFAALSKTNSDDSDLRSTASHVHDTYYHGPLELAQIHDGTSGPVWGDVPNLTGIYYQGSYWGNLLNSQCYDDAPGECNPALGAKNMLDPYGYIDGPPNQPGTSYFVSSLGVQKSFVATMFLMPDICRIVNYPDIVEYVDRVMASGIISAPDPCVTPDSREDFENCDPYRNQGCDYYGVTWGAVTPSDPASDCITTVTPGYTKQGRFASLHGTAIYPYYTSAQVEANWAAIRGTGYCYTGVAFEQEGALNLTIETGTLNFNQ